MTSRAHALTAALAMAAALAAPACAEPATVTDYADLAGEWSGDGDFRGAPSRVTATFAPALNDQFWTLTVVTTIASGDGEDFRFEGRAFYPADAAEDGAHWFDTMGGSYDIQPRFEDGALIVDWGHDGLEAQSRYSFSDDGALLIEDMVLSEDGPAPFARARLSRAPSDAPDP